MKNKIIFTIVIMFFLFMATPANAQEITPTATITVTPTMEWDFPAEGLQPYTYTVVTTQSPISYTLNRDDVWRMARVALTTYNIMGLRTWAFLGIVIVVPIAAAFIFRIYINPPEI